MLNAINAVIFDMDGVIFDSEKVYYDAFFMAADQLEVEADHDFVLSFSGKSSPDCQLMLQQFFDGDTEKTRRFFQHWGLARLDILSEHGLDFKEGFLTLFDAIKASGRPIGLVTSAYYADMRENFERNDAALLDDFTHIITIEDVKFPKPDPQPYRMMMRHLSQAPENCIVIEDSISGISAALSAGARTIMINDAIEPPQDLAEQLLFKAGHHDNILAFLQDNGL